MTKIDIKDFTKEILTLKIKNVPINLKNLKMRNCSIYWV